MSKTSHTGGFANIKPHLHPHQDDRDDMYGVVLSQSKIGDEGAAAVEPLGGSTYSAFIHPIEPGLAIATCPDAFLLADLRSTFTSRALEGGRKHRIPFPKVKNVLSLLSGNRRLVEQFKIKDAANGNIANGAQHDFKVIGNHHAYNFCGNEGLVIVLQEIQAATGTGWVIFEQPQENFPFSPAFVQGLTLIRSAAKQNGVLVMLLMVCPEGYEKTHLYDHCDEHFEAAPCQPDPGIDTAFSVDWVNMHGVGPLGIAKTMVSVRISADGQIKRLYEQFVSPDLMTRAIWILRGQGKSLEEIGDLLHMNKSTVSRRLLGLPKPRNVSMPDDWLANYLESVQSVLAEKDFD